MNDFNKLKSGSRSPHTLHYLVWRFLPCLLIIIIIIIIIILLLLLLWSFYHWFSFKKIKIKQKLKDEARKPKEANKAYE